MPNVSIYFREPEEKEKFESEALALGAKAIRYALEYLNDPRAIKIQCTQLRVTTYDDYCLVMNAIKDVKENYLVEGKAVKKQ